MPRRVSWAEQIDRERTAAVRRASAELRRQEADARRRARDAKQAHVETRLEEADEKNDALAAQLTELERLLSDGVTREWSLDLQSLKLPLTAPPFDPRGADKPASPPDLQIPKPPGWFARLVPGSSARYQRLCDDAKSKHEQAMHSYEASEDVRIAGLTADELTARPVPTVDQLNQIWSLQASVWQVAHAKRFSRRAQLKGAGGTP